MSRLDVAIVGGGPVGLTLALALEQAGAAVAVVDAAAPEAALVPEFDGRAFAIAYANFRMWRALGLGEALDPVVQPIARIMVTDGRPLDGVRKGGPSLLHLMFEADEAGEALGYMVEHRHLRKALEDRIRASGVTRIAPMGVASFETSATGVSLTLADRSTIDASLLVGADGRRSFVRTRTGIRTVGWEYDATAIVATVRHQKPHDAVAHEFFLPSGPFAILPLTGNRANIVWAEPRKVAAAINAMNAEDFRAELKRRFGDFLGEVWLEGPRFSYPLSMQIAEKMIAPRVALAGDSAHAIHPIAGQGLNLGLKDAAALAECVGDALALGLDAGDATALTRYQRWRRFNNVGMACAMEFFDRLFSNDIAPVRAVRRLGLDIVNRVGPARRFFMRQAGGAGGALPKLLRGEGLGV